jgi:hypothetical protein
MRKVGVFLPWLIFFTLMVGKLALLQQTPLPDDISGDEIGYVAKARYFYQHGSFPPLTSAEDGALQYSDYRPPGYPTLISLLLPFGNEITQLRHSVNLVQYTMDLLVATLLLVVAFQFRPAKGFRLVAALILGIQPWTSAHIASLYADTLAMFLTVAGVVCLAMFGHFRWVLARTTSITMGSFLLSLTATVRPEMIVLAPALLVLAGWLEIRRMPWRVWLGYATLAALPFLLVVGLNMAYHWQTEKHIRIIAHFRHPTPGLNLWTKTWIGPQWLKEELLFGGLTRTRTDEEHVRLLAKYALPDPMQCDATIRIIHDVQSRGFMTAEEDDIFAEIAAARIAAAPWTYYMWGRVYNSAYLWLNLSSATHYLTAQARCPRLVSKSITAGLFGMKIFILIFATGGMLSVWRNKGILRTSWPGRFVLIGAACIVLRTLFFGFVFNTAEFRYALVAWPLMLAVALYGLARGWT